MTKATLRRQDLAEIADLMTEAAAVVHLLPASVVRRTLVPDLMAMSALGREVLDASAGVSVEQAKKVLEQESRGTLERTSSAQGGRAWLKGEWRLEELEALCLILRQQASDQARGAVEFVVVRKDEE